MDVLIERFISDCRAKNLAPRTIDWYSKQLKMYCAWAGPRDWRNPRTARDFLECLLSRPSRYAGHPRRPAEMGGLSPFTVRGYARALRRFSSWLVEEELEVQDLYARLKLPKAPKAIPRGLAETDFQKLLAAALTPRDRPVLLFLRETGCRASELCSLRRADLFLDQGYALIRGKGGQDGFLFFTSPTCEALRVYLAETAGGEYVFYSRRSTKDGFVVEPLKYSTLALLLKRLKARAGVKGRCNAHSFRHAFARDQLVAGNNLATVSDLLRHSDIAVTKIYAGYEFEALRAAHARYSPVK